MKNTDKQFYIFLDIDGVLWDWQWRVKQIKNGKILRGTNITQFNPESVYALNILISELNKTYSCSLVISSTWRTFMDITKQTLIKNNVKLPKEVLRTNVPISQNRGVEILNFLNAHPTDNYIIIDDETKDIEKYFPQEKIIKTNIKNKSLRLSQVKKMLESINEQSFEPEQY